MGRLDPQRARLMRKELFEYIDSVDLAVTETIVNPQGVMPCSGNKDTTILLEATDTISSAIRHKNEKCTILNFASYKNPGGGFMKDMLAQEEAICYCTNLYDTLLENQEWYNAHAKTLHGGYYTNESLFSKNITVLASAPGNLMAEDECFTVDVLTCAAPNWTRTLRYGCDSIENASAATTTRIYYVMAVLAEQKCETLILGAFGCGVFKNDPNLVAQTFKNLLYDYYPGIFKKVVFAIPDENSQNYKAFKTAFAK